MYMAWLAKAELAPAGPARAGWGSATRGEAWV